MSSVDDPTLQELYSVVFPRNVTEFSYRYHESSRADMMVSFQALEGTSRYTHTPARYFLNPAVVENVEPRVRPSLRLGSRVR